MDFDAKQLLLTAIYLEYQKNISNMDTIKHEQLGISFAEFKAAAEKLDNERLVSGIQLERGGREALPMLVSLNNAKMTSQGSSYVERKFGISDVLSGRQKVETMRDRARELKLERVVLLADEVLNQM